MNGIPSRQCLVCGTVFYKPTNCSATEWQEQRRYCSYRCYWIAKRKTLDRPCAHCKKQFPYTSSNPNQRYCSVTCRDAAMRKSLPLCETCGETCNKASRRFCSRECKVEWYRGTNVYNYVGGRAGRHYASSFWLERASSVRERDRVCRHCGASPETVGTLHVHHVIPRRLSHDDSLDNLIALCRRCHKKAEDAIRRNGS